MELVPLLRRHRAPLVIGYDVVVWIAAYFVFAWLRFDTVSDRVPWLEVVHCRWRSTALLYVVGRRVPADAPGPGQHRQPGGDGAPRRGHPGVGFVVSFVNLFAQWLPRSVPAGATLAALVAAAWGRALWRRLREIDDEGLEREGATRVIVVGAGEAGRELIGSMLRDPLRPVAPRRAARRRPQQAAPPDPARPGPRAGRPRLGEQVRAPARTPSSSRSRAPPPETINRIRLAALDADVAVKVLPVHHPAAHRHRRHPRPARHQPHRRARSQPARHRHRLDRRVPHRSPGAGHRRRRLDRLRAVPPDPPLRARRADDARPRRVGAALRSSSRSTAGRCSTPTT